MDILFGGLPSGKTAIIKAASLRYTRAAKVLNNFFEDPQSKSFKEVKRFIEKHSEGSVDFEQILKDKRSDYSKSIYQQALKSIAKESIQFAKSKILQSNENRNQ